MNTYRSFSDARQEACEKCGILYPHDGARHSFGTYGYFVGGKPWAMRCMGHNNQVTYDQYYLNTGVGKEEAEEYFKVFNIAPYRSPNRSPNRSQSLQKCPKNGLKMPSM